MEGGRAVAFFCSLQQRKGTDSGDHIKSWKQNGVMTVLAFEIRRRNQSAAKGLLSNWPVSGCKAAHTPSLARVLLATSCRIKKKKNPPDTHIESVARMLFCPKDVFLGPRKGLDHWRVYKSHLQNTR